jgi:predicted RNA-binding protein with TRAM domain
MRFQRSRGGFGGGRRFDRGPRDDTPKPINAGEEYDVEITEVGSRGDGIARIKNFVVFVTDVKKGDKVKIKIKEVRDRFATGEKVGEGSSDGAEVTEEKSETAEVTEEKSETTEEETTEETEESEEEPAEESEEKEDY